VGIIGYLLQMSLPNIYFHLTLDGMVGSIFDIVGMSANVCLSRVDTPRLSFGFRPKAPAFVTSTPQPPRRPSTPARHRNR
jgi:hypothetical protein